ncbi:MAG: GNAT family N-acetyltransferase [Bacteroides sp.]|nr:GNAT family N-acetyltransferase [Bacteroides sp.]
MELKIRKARLNEIDQLMNIYDYARQYMQQTGNSNQWINGYPSRELIISNIQEGNLYVCIDDVGKEIGVFYFKIDEDPTYAYIEDGKWLNNKPYGVVHRLAGNGKYKGIAAFCFDWCFKQWPNIRVDTHEDNKVMQHILEKEGFIRCGIIYIANGTPRIAYQKYNGC